MTEVFIDRLAYGGDGIGKLPSGKTVFVPNSCPGDKVKINIVQESQRFDRGEIQYILEPSLNRLPKQKCPNAKLCGGCPWQFMDYNLQLEWKRRFVVDSLQRIAKIDNAEEIVADCVASPTQWGYRNKIELVPTMEGGKLQLGFHAPGSNEVVAIESCPLFAKGHERIAKSLGGALRYLKADEYGLLRVGVRASKITNSLQVALWTKPDYFPRKAAVDVIRSAVSCTSLVRILFKDDVKARKPVSTETLHGVDFWKERIAGTTMKISAPSFFQVNTLAAENLIEVAMSQLDIQDNEICCDLYCGAGTFTLPMAKKSSMVYAIESSSSSIRDLRRNLDDNDLDAEVIGGDAARESKDLGRIDVLLMDPPYNGMNAEIFKSVTKLSPKRIALVSCNPTTLARDLIGLRDIGYDLRTATPVDLFPQTYHVETVVILDRAQNYKERISASIQRQREQDARREQEKAAQAKKQQKGSFSGHQGNRQQPRKHSNKYSGKYGRN